ncbi:MAG TPA: alkaline phosphatase D family protein, partial [Nannocystaceae bacterium]|nr:alkaline phosphatase D family protein [Nannocystaceae bacterium]
MRRARHRATRASTLRWVALAALGTGAWLLRHRIAARIPGARARLQRRAAKSDFFDGEATRLVAVGIPDHRSARVWVRSDRSGAHMLTLERDGGQLVHRGRFEVPDDPACDRTTAVRIPEDIDGPPLHAYTRYRVEIHAADGTSIGAARFTTAPLGEHDAPDRFALALASCHQPFADDGSIQPGAAEVLHELPELLEQHGVEAVLLLGDQMYNDLPAGHSLFDDAAFARVAPKGRKHVLECSREEVRAILQQRYRVFWKVPAFARLQARFPSLCMLDDHELVDNFGTAPEHREPPWRTFAAGALDAFHDYQGLRTSDRPRPEEFSARFAWGPVAALVLDLRSQRVAFEERIEVLGESQWRALDRFLDDEVKRPVLMLGLSVPLVHAAEWVVASANLLAPRGSAAHEQWSHPHQAGQRDRLVHRLLEHRRRAPQQRIVLLSGDVHVGTVCELSIGDTAPILQVVSSALTNYESVVVRAGSSESAELARELETA